MMKDERLRLLREITIREHQRCPVCSQGDYNPTVVCCTANDEIKELGKQLEKAVNRRKGSAGVEQEYRENYAKWKQVAIDNGLGERLYRDRVINKRWSPEDAACVPKFQRPKKTKRKEGIT